jgi:integrase
MVPSSQGSEPPGKPGRFTLFHDLRRTFCHDAAEAGADYKTIMDWTGHKTTSTFLRYRIVSLDGMKRAANRVADYRQAQAQRREPRP